jgi:hypothetical protein
VSVTSGVVVGVRPWLPGALGRWAWLTAPIRAERLAALRIGVGLVLLLDIVATYLPYLRDYYGPGSLADPDVFASRFAAPFWHWSVLRGLPDTWGPPAALAVWAVAALALTVGFYPRVAAAVAWALSLSFYNSNYYLHNSGDRLRHTLLFFLMLCPCGAVWALARCSCTRGRSGCCSCNSCSLTSSTASTSSSAPSGATAPCCTTSSTTPAGPGGRCRCRSGSRAVPRGS